MNDFQKVPGALQPQPPFVPAPGYEKLVRVLRAAHDQAAYSKGKERHASPEPFDQQKIMWITREAGLGFPVGQVIKKVLEAKRLAHSGDFHRAKADILGAINYLAAFYLRTEELEHIVARERDACAQALTRGSDAQADVTPAPGIILDRVLPCGCLNNCHGHDAPT